MTNSEMKRLQIDSAGTSRSAASHRVKPAGFSRRKPPAERSPPKAASKAAAKPRVVRKPIVRKRPAAVTGKPNPPRCPRNIGYFKGSSRGRRWINAMEIRAREAVAAKKATREAPPSVPAPAPAKPKASPKRTSPRLASPPPVKFAPGGPPNQLSAELEHKAESPKAAPPKATWRGNNRVRRSK